jgi:hypothetical protein
MVPAMPRPKKTPGKPPRVPPFCLYKATGQAYFKAGGRVVYLGVHGTPESRDAYAEGVAAILAERELPTPVRTRRAPSQRASTLTVGEVCRRYVQHARGYYMKHGRPTPKWGWSPALAVMRPPCLAIYRPRRSDPWR